MEYTTAQKHHQDNSYKVAFFDQQEQKCGSILSFIEVDNEQYALIKPFRTKQFGLSRDILSTAQSAALKLYGAEPLCPHLSEVV